MSPKIWLPNDVAARRRNELLVKDDQTGRETILILPTSGGSSYESKQHEQEVVEAAKERTIEEMRAKGSIPKRIYSRQEVGKALKEFREWAAKVRQGTGNPRYY